MTQLTDAQEIDALMDIVLALEGLSPERRLVVLEYAQRRYSGKGAIVGRVTRPRASKKGHGKGTPKTLPEGEPRYKTNRKEVEAWGRERHRDFTPDTLVKRFGVTSAAASSWCGYLVKRGLAQRVKRALYRPIQASNAKAATN